MAVQTDPFTAGRECHRLREAWWLSRSELDAAKLAEGGACVGFVQARVTRVEYEAHRERFLAALDREGEAWDAFVDACNAATTTEGWGRLRLADDPAACGSGGELAVLNEPALYTRYDGDGCWTFLDADGFGHTVVTGSTAPAVYPDDAETQRVFERVRRELNWPDAPVVPISDDPAFDHLRDATREARAEGR